MTTDLDSAAGTKPYVVTLGTVGGPRWWRGATDEHRAGIATAVVVGDSTYLVDCGHGVGTQLTKAGLSVESLRGIFITHLHSDHTVDLGSLTAFGMFDRTANQTRMKIIGPGDRGKLPPVSNRTDSAPQPVFAERPTPGITEMFSNLVAAHATDINDRVLDALRPSPFDLFAPEDISIPGRCGFDPNTNPTPPMEPFTIHSDDRVTVTATLVQHPPVAPAFAFRFDTDGGSVTISGDTAPCDNLVRLASGTDLLLHEAIDFGWVYRAYGGKGDLAGQASIDHHEKSHTSPHDAVAIAHRAGAKALALHHIVPGHTPRSVWLEAGDEFDGRFLVPKDLDVIPFGALVAAT
ncbi:MBL fold metallo-hydrolase [Haloactinomyces albus]|uniref:Ribonuclease BN (tRNA processing enzyme) n=1 Tax=Haloactinomyces albus TaxID=1352928 RepID=A0AAE4CQ12_9ACTN|nr:MBL fold metallo-hydrolase [Haloactinomyces albus]MDR7303627.1 ribonuclease BN (tRNA processing enzyme) [Haloactinomyces albus]